MVPIVSDIRLVLMSRSGFQLSPATSSRFSRALDLGVLGLDGKGWFWKVPLIAGGLGCLGFGGGGLLLTGGGFLGL